jgi:hypothetical protein
VLRAGFQSRAKVSAGYRGNCIRAKGRVPIPRQGFGRIQRSFPVSALRAGFQPRVAIAIY